ncbi:MAG: precorrin-6y C5,15-methyltransferase (decarboxylating) subunit CbiE [Gammaproteobacteria bacterium]|nr:precorrin-6y C5,15-methyltransferase (decarboxylating) subunit CbiE [Gammaproteobacteria bacterium]
MIDVIGLGVSDKALLSSEAQLAIRSGAVVIGSARQLATVNHLFEAQQKIELPKLSELKKLLGQYADQAVVILASGDPLHYGIGRWLVKQVGREALNFHPAVSSIQAACHHLGLALQDVEVLSLHGRGIEKIRRSFKAQQHLVILTDQHSQPARLAQECLDSGYGASTLWVCELLGYPQQRIRQFSVDQLLNDQELEFDPLHVTVIDVQGLGQRPQFPGFADHLFITGQPDGKGMITKREVRLMILSLLAPAVDDIIWDIGAGCGSVAIELAYWQPRATIHAIEHHPQRLSCLAQNRDKFGVVDNLLIVEGRAPQQLADLPNANKVFIGGSDGELNQLLQQTWQQLPINGVLVASAVTEQTKAQFIAFSADVEHGDCETMSLAVSRGQTLAGQLMYKPNYPVTLFKITKTTKITTTARSIA